MNKQQLNQIISIQKREITEHHIYKKLASRSKIEKNTKILNHIAGHELKHYNILKKYSKVDVKPSKFGVNLYYFFAIVFGLTFTLKLMEMGENNAHNSYYTIKDIIPEVDEILIDEQEHEKELIDMLKESKLDYVGSVVLGLNDALVELTGALAGFTFAIANSKTIALIGLITGISASFSMAASEFLSNRHDGEDLNKSAKSALYTGTAYIFTVFFLILPFMIFQNHYLNLLITMSIAILIIAIFNFYISVAKDYNFKKRFIEMACISIGVAIISFFIGVAVKNYIGLEI